MIILIKFSITRSSIAYKLKTRCMAHKKKRNETLKKIMDFCN